VRLGQHPDRAVALIAALDTRSGAIRGFGENYR
jgi:hypothetical protein